MSDFSQSLLFWVTGSDAFLAQDGLPGRTGGGSHNDGTHFSILASLQQHKHVNRE